MEVSHFTLQVEDELDSNLYEHDGVVEVISSSIISKLIEIGDIHEDHTNNFRHIVIGFNEIGSYLTVICSQFEPQ